MTVPFRLSIAILFVTMNPVAMLHERLASCASQNEAPDRLAVIDVGSTTGARDVLREYDSLVTYSISDPNKGMFDALNEGLRHVRPEEYVLVLGADHRFYDDHVRDDAGSQGIRATMSISPAFRWSRRTNANRPRGESLGATADETFLVAISPVNHISHLIDIPTHSLGLAAMTPAFVSMGTTPCATC
jgi:glycosyltransferase involved in cell wall biosynthesis